MANTPIADNDASRVELLQKLFERIFRSGYTLSRCKDATIAERLYPGPTDSMSVAGRSLAWKLFLEKEEPLQASLPPRAPVLLENLQASRKKYATLLDEYSKPPDTKPGKSPSTHTARPRSIDGIGNLDMVNPLSLHNENPWNDWFAGVELRKVILQDVERTFPDIAFFRDADVQAELTNILFLYSTMHPSTGYRQGMHELLAPLYFAVHHDAVTPEQVDDSSFNELIDICSVDFIAADAWALFNAVMNGVSRWYEWREADPQGGSATNSLASFPNHAVLPSNGQTNIQPYVAPIVQACNHIQTNLLQACDPTLWQSIQKAGIEPQIYGIRWLRLLFTREFSMPDSMKLWDCLFACDSTLELAQWICVAMLIRIRNELIPADYSGQLTTLLRYPTPSSSKIDGAPHHAILLLRQALALQMAPNPATGSSIVMENRNLLGIPIEVPDIPVPERTRSSRLGRPQPLSAQSSTGTGSLGRSHLRQGSAPGVGISEMLTRGLIERGETLGINRASIMNAVTEIRASRGARNIPELAASLGVNRTPNQQLASFPLVDERPAEERPPWEPRTRFEVEKDISLMRARDKRLGESLAWIVDSLLQDESEAANAQKIKLQKQEALESLSYVRDVLMLNEMALDDDRLIGGEERSRRKQKAQKEAEELQAASALAVVAPPIPVPVADSHFTHASPYRMRPQSPPRAASMHTQSASTSVVGQRAPWNYTRSNFSTPTSAVPTALLPRPPPPTSTSLRREPQKSRDQTPTQTAKYQDPLGALP